MSRSRRHKHDDLDEGAYLESIGPAPSPTCALSPHPEPLGFSESFEQYLERSGLRLPFRDKSDRTQDPDCICRGRREHYRHDAECPVGIVYRRWDAFMRERWEQVRGEEA